MYAVKGVNHCGKIQRTRSIRGLGQGSAGYSGSGRERAPSLGERAIHGDAKFPVRLLLVVVFRA